MWWGLINLSFLSPPAEQQTVVLLPRSPSASKTYLPIPVDHLEEEYRLRSADDGKLFREEYNVSTPSSDHAFVFKRVVKVLRSDTWASALL